MYSKSLILKLIVILDVIIPSGQSGVMLNTSISPQSPWLSSRSQFVQLLLRIFFCVDPDSCEFACNRILTRGQTNQTNLKTVICNADDLFPTDKIFFFEDTLRKIHKKTHYSAADVCFMLWLQLYFKYKLKNVTAEQKPRHKAFMNLRTSSFRKECRYFSVSGCFSHFMKSPI